MYKITLNKNKSIGKAVFIVEGDKKEHTLLGYIFKEILEYSIIDVKRNSAPISKYVSSSNPDSRVFVVSSGTSNITSAGKSGKDYLDQVFLKLFNEYSLDITNAAVYYIFDRDNESNMFCEAEKLTQTLRNSRDNGIESNGLLLLSYPCIEAYIKSCVDEYTHEVIDTPGSMKRVVSDARYQYNKINSESIIRACNNMLIGIKEICGRDISHIDLDDFTEVGCRILNLENDWYLDKKQYMLLSLLSVAFLDLGIIDFQYS